MAARLDGALEARRILERQGHLADGLLDGPLSASWQRCLAAGLDPWQTPDIPTLDVGELRSRGEHSQRVARLARIEMESLFHQIAGSNFMIAFGDPDGVVIDTIADPIFAVSDAGRQIRAGTVWSESIAGTNATGTATTTGQGLIVHGAEHFFSCFDGITCAAAPIQYADGSLAGVLDASSFCDAYPSHTLVLVRMAALNVANGLFRGEMHGHFIVELHARPEFLGSIAAGMLAVDRDGVLRGISSQAPALMPGVQLRAGMAFDEVFTEDFGLVLERLRREGRTRVFDPLDRAYAMALRDPGQMRAQAAARTPEAVRVGDLLVPPGVPMTHVPPPDGMAAVLTGAAPGRLARGAPAMADHVKGELPDLVCQDARVQECLRLVEAAVRLPAPVLITGETGTGKEMLARYAHRISGRRGELVAVNCAAMPAELFEAELFGYSAGAFTGARREGHGGLILEADGGTLLLDEIADLPPPLQAALLRFLDDFQVRPVGGRVSRVVDTLVIAATNADLHRAVAERRFRADLLYRLNTVQVVLPPLRERSDLAAVARVVLARIDPLARISDGALQALAAHDWPGNVRELRAVLTRARLMADAAEIEARHLGLQVPPAAGVMPGRSESGQAAAGTLRTLSGELVRRTCAELDGNVSATAQRLAISRTTVYRYLREAGHG